MTSVRRTVVTFAGYLHMVSRNDKVHPINCTGDFIFQTCAGSSSKLYNMINVWCTQQQKLRIARCAGGPFCKEAVNVASLAITPRSNDSAFTSTDGSHFDDQVLVNTLHRDAF